MKRKVAIYARVSTEHEAQLSALDNQVQYYDDILKKNPDWILYDRYIDEGITGTSTNEKYTLYIPETLVGCGGMFITLIFK